MSESDLLPGTIETVKIRGTVKWFNVVKGYGFITPDDGSPDVFLHLTVLRTAGHERLAPGATVECNAVKGAKGMQVLSVVSVDTSTAVAEDYLNEQQPTMEPAPEHTGPVSDFMSGTVKWFNPHKGYGFVCLDNSEESDIFVHMVILRNAGIASLITGQAVEVRVADGPKGRQAAEVKLSTAPPVSE